MSERQSPEDLANKSERDTAYASEVYALYNQLADAEAELGRHFAAGLKEGPIQNPSPQWTLWRRYQDALARSMAFRAMAEAVREGITPENNDT